MSIPDPVKDEVWQTMAGQRLEILCVGNERVFIRWLDSGKEDTLPMKFFDEELGVLRLL